jgi:ribonuclease P protein component
MPGNSCSRSGETRPAAYVHGLIGSYVSSNAGSKGVPEDYPYPTAYPPSSPRHFSPIAFLTSHSGDALSQEVGAGLVKPASPAIETISPPRSAFGGAAHKVSVVKETFTKRDRIRSKGDFERLKRSGVRLTDGVFLLVVQPTNLGFSRLGIAVPKRVGGAVMRNRYKRLIRETFRLNRDSLPGSIDLLVVVKRAPDPPILNEFRDRILSLLSRYRGPNGTDEGNRADSATDNGTA